MARGKLRSPHRHAQQVSLVRIATGASITRVPLPASVLATVSQHAGHSGVDLDALGECSPAGEHGRRSGVCASCTWCGTCGGQGKADVVVGVIAQACYPAVGAVNATLSLPPAPAARRSPRLRPLPATQSTHRVARSAWPRRGCADDSTPVIVHGNVSVSCAANSSCPRIGFPSRWRRFTAAGFQ